MEIEPRNVFLLSGQAAQTVVGGRMGLSPVIEQRLVLAVSQERAYECLAQAEPGFQVAGHASLYDYECAVLRIRDALRGKDTGLPVFIA